MATLPAEDIEGGSSNTLTRSRLLLGGAVVYLAVIFGAMLWRGVSIEPEWVVLALLLVAVALGRGKRFVVDWAPFLVLFLAYEAMRGFAGGIGIRPYDMGRWEQALFGGTLPTVWLQQRLYDVHRISPLDWAAMTLYFMHFAVPLVAGFLLWLRSRERYWQFVAALLLMSFAAFVVYLFFPSAPPWWQYHGEVHKVIDETIQKWGVRYYVSPVYDSFNPNRFAAFPSLHAAYPALAAVFVGKVSRAAGAVLWTWAACVWFAIVYLGEHYVIDAAAGLVFVALATAAVHVAMRIRRRRAMPA